MGKELLTTDNAIFTQTGLYSIAIEVFEKPNKFNDNNLLGVIIVEILDRFDKIISCFCGEDEFLTQSIVDSLKGLGYSFESDLLGFYDLA